MGIQRELITRAKQSSAEVKIDLGESNRLHTLFRVGDDNELADGQSLEQTVFSQVNMERSELPKRKAL